MSVILTLLFVFIFICSFIYFYRDEFSFDEVIDKEKDVAFEIQFEEFDLEEVKGIGPKTKEKLEDAFEDVKEIYKAADAELEEFLSETKIKRLRSKLEEKLKD